MYGGEYASEEEMPLWYNFIVSEEVGTYAVIATYDEDFAVFYLWTPSDDVCMLTPDWKSDNREDNIWGFYVNDTMEGNGCPYIESEGWSYASYTYDEETNDPISIVGPYGNEWIFISPEDFAVEYPTWFADFNSLMSGESQGELSDDEPLWWNFIVNDEMATWAIFATYDEEFEVFYLYTPDESVCMLTPDWKSDNKEDNIWGFYVNDTLEGNGCPYIEELGWTYASYTYDEET
jgi:hypothetical protein